LFLGKRCGRLQSSDAELIQVSADASFVIFAAVAITTKYTLMVPDVYLH
jgi:hypothetical protein